MKFKVDKVYIISLDKSHENVKNMISKVKDIGLPNKAPIEIVGIDGWSLTNDDLTKIGIKPLEEWNLHMKDVDNRNRYHNRDLTKGEIGCSLSHIHIWEDAYKNNYENIIIYEEDFCKVPNQDIDWLEIDEASKSRDGKGFDLLYLGRSLQYGRSDVWDNYFSETFCLPGMSYQSHAYILSKSGLKTIVESYLDRFKSGIFPLDDFLAACYTCIFHKPVEAMYTDKTLFALAFNYNKVYQNRIKPSLTEPKEDL